MQARQTFSEFLMRESVQQQLQKLSSSTHNNKMLINGMIFNIDERTVEQDYLEGYAEDRSDAGKLMKYIRKKGLSTGRIGATGLLIQNLE